ncbi:putative rdRP-domain-containing protein [Lyophyllum shimeji]|uniref:RNA-dependent RNA polymerase n=1 Tax=Lyophyllum shimeji TaxID=47721 RepID=A0A9P3PUA9_LYOSH|nr:putative rdRP-domain-containing protein [Lyophyllum shimeji]
MQIFMRGIPLHTDKEDFKITIAKLIHRPPFPTPPPLNFDIRFFRVKPGARAVLGLLTLPDTSAGELFLSTFSNGIPFGTARVLFSRTKTAPDEALIAQVASTPWEDPVRLRDEAEKRKTDSAEIPLATFAFGRLCRDGVFSPEVRRAGRCTVSCDIDNRRVRLTVHGGDPSNAAHDHGDLFETGSELLKPTVHVWYRASQILALCMPDSQCHDRDDPLSLLSVILEGNASPVFEQTSLLDSLQLVDGRPPPSQRAESIFGNSPMPCVGRFLQLAFQTLDDLLLFVNRSRRINLRHPIYSTIRIVERGLYAKHVEAKCQQVLQQLPFPLAFEIDKAIYSGVVDPTEVVELQGALGKLLNDRGEETAAILRWFFARIPAPSLKNLNKLALKDILAEFSVVANKKRRNRRQRRRNRNHRPAPVEEIPDPTLSDLLERAAKVYAPDVPRSGPLIAATPAIYQSYHLIITPSSRIPEGPLPDQSSSILRRFGNNDCFLRVTFQDDNRLTLRQDFTFNISIKNLLASRYKRALVKGITVAGRHFEFLGYSMSGLKQHSVFFVNPFEFETANGKKLMTAEAIRSTLIRVGGAKGVIFQDPTLTGKVLCLRPSQTKFETDTTLTLDIASDSSRPIRMFLNRPLIMLLEHLGVKNETFIRLQQDAIDTVDYTRSSFREASKVLQQHGLGASFRLPSLLNNLVSQLKLEDDAVTPRILRCDLITNSLADSATHILRELKFRGRIPVPGSFTLIGVSDEWGCLRKGEIYATIRDERNDVHLPIEGEVLITRSPQIHPGDVRLVTAVRRPELAHLNNVVVFSCEGDRSLPSCLGGGDLDGDIYNLILNRDLFPTRTVAPGSYRGLPHRETAGPCTVSDVADFVIDYLEADLVGTISNRHLCIADLDPLGPECADCLLLAEYASHAVDFPKTGRPVDFSKLPRTNTRLKPDFLSTEVTDTSRPDSAFYPSKKILGTLYRRVPLRDDDPEYLDPSFGPVISDALARLRTDRLGLPSISMSALPDDVLEEMDDLLEMYTTELQFIAKAHTLAKHPNEQLTEAELVSGTIQAKWSDHHKRRDTVASMNLQTQQLTKAIRRELRRVEAPAEDATAEEGMGFEDEEDDDDDDEYRLSNRDIQTFVRSAAAWHVANEQLIEAEEAIFGAASFGLIALGVMLDVIKKASRTAEGSLTIKTPVCAVLS